MHQFKHLQINARCQVREITLLFNTSLGIGNIIVDTQIYTGQHSWSPISIMITKSFYKTMFVENH